MAKASGWAAWRAKKGAGGGVRKFAKELRHTGAKLELRPTPPRQKLAARAKSPGTQTDNRLANRIETARRAMSGKLAKAYGVGPGRAGGPGAYAGYRAAHEKAVDRAYAGAARGPFQSRISTKKRG